MQDIRFFLFYKRCSVCESQESLTSQVESFLDLLNTAVLIMQHCDLSLAEVNAGIPQNE